VISRYYRSVLFTAIVLALFSGMATTAFAQETTTDDDDAKLRPLEPDFKIIDLPTTLPLPVHGGVFELTHRFNGNWRGRDFGDVASDFFGIDEGATIDFGYRFGLAKHVEVAASRTNFNRTIEFQGKYDAFHQEQRPIGLSAIISVEGENNFRENYAGALGLSLSRTVGSVAAIYVDPFWVHNSAAITGITRDTGFIGVGGRLRFLPGAFLLAEVSPRVGGYAPGDPLWAFGIEKRVGGHVFQLNWGNTTAGATYAEIARGGSPGGLYLGFNLSRKFF
jgi:uncharacterized beta barrel domain-containing protein DUF5777